MISSYPMKHSICSHLDLQEVAQALTAQKLASPYPYKQEYKEQVRGKGPDNPSIGYPEHDHHKKVGEQRSTVRNALMQKSFLLI